MDDKNGIKTKSSKKLVCFIIVLLLIVILGGFFAWKLGWINIVKVQSNGMELPKNPTETENYLWENSTVLEVIEVENCENILSEKQAIELFEERGFSQNTITYDYSINGKYLEEQEAQSDSAEKHPMYTTVYISENGDVWSIYLINSSILANPLSFNSESELNAPVMYSEFNFLISYSSDQNNFYKTIPFDSTVITKQIDEIDANQLNKINSKEIENNEK